MKEDRKKRRLKRSKKEKGESGREAEGREGKGPRCRSCGTSSFCVATHCVTRSWQVKLCQHSPFWSCATFPVCYLEQHRLFWLSGLGCSYLQRMKLNLSVLPSPSCLSVSILVAVCMEPLRLGDSKERRKRYSSYS